MKILNSLNFFESTFKFIKLSPKNAVILFLLSIISGFLQTIAIFSIFPLINLYNLLPLDSSGIFFINFYQKYFIDFWHLQNNLITVLAFLFIFVSISSLINFIIRFYAAYISTVLNRRLRMRYINLTLNSKWAYFVNKKTGEIVNTVILEASKSAYGFVDTVNFFSNTLQFIVFFIFVIFLSKVVALYALVVGIIYLLIFRIWAIKARKFSYIAANLSKIITNNISDGYKNIKTLKVSGKTNYLSGIMKKTVFSTQKNDLNLMMTQITPESLKEPFFAFFLSLGIFFFLTYEYAAISSLLTLIALFQRAMSKLSLAYTQFITVKKMEAYFNSYNENVFLVKSYSSSWHGKNYPNFDSSIIFQNVSFGYGGTKIFNETSVEIKKGSFVSISGPSGVGKTTFVDLLSGLYMPINGKILVDNIDLKSCNIHQWQNKIGYVTQDHFFFNDSVRTNLTLDNNNISEEQIINALEISNSYEFLRNKKDFLDSSMGESGLLFSGGQRQRLSIARAILFNPDILILDEATSAVDNDTEKSILENIKVLKNKNMTIISISHNREYLNYIDTEFLIKNNKIIKN